MPDRYDVIVIGAGPAGEVATSRLNKQGLRTALIERELVGGDIAGRDVNASYHATARAVFSDPEIASVGLIGVQGSGRGIDVASSRISLPETIARPRTYE